MCLVLFTLLPVHLAFLNLPAVKRSLFVATSDYLIISLTVSDAFSLNLFFIFSFRLPFPLLMSCFAEHSLIYAFVLLFAVHKGNALQSIVIYIGNVCFSPVLLKCLECMHVFWKIRTSLGMTCWRRTGIKRKLIFGIGSTATRQPKSKEKKIRNDYCR